MSGKNIVLDVDFIFDTIEVGNQESQQHSIRHLISTIKNLQIQNEDSDISVVINQNIQDKISPKVIAACASSLGVSYLMSRSKTQSLELMSAISESVGESKTSIISRNPLASILGRSPKIDLSDSINQELEVVDLSDLDNRSLQDVIALIGTPDKEISQSLLPSAAMSLIADHGSLEAIMKNTNKLNIAYRMIMNSKMDTIKENIESSKAFISDLIDRIEHKNLQMVGYVKHQIENKPNISEARMLKVLSIYNLGDLMPILPLEVIKEASLKNLDAPLVRHLKTKEEMNLLLDTINFEKGIAVLKNDNIFGFSQSPGVSFTVDYNTEFGRNACLNILKNASSKIITHNGKRLIRWAHDNGINDLLIGSDTQLLQYTLNSKADNESFEDLLGEDELEALRVHNKDPKQKTGHATSKLLQKNRELFHMASQDEISRSLFSRVERPLLHILAKMEIQGIRLDLNHLDEIEKDVSLMDEKVNLVLSSRTKKSVKTSALSDLSDLIFDEIGLPDPSGKRSTAKENLMKIRHHDPELIDAIIDKRELEYLVSNILTPYRAKFNNETGRLHTNLMQCVTSSTRLSSRDPNLQGAPKKGWIGKKVRESFKAGSMHKIVAIDYSQVELRVLAHLSKDTALINAFKNGMDIHAATASEVFSIPLEDVTSDQRRFAKAINFGIVYKMTAFGLSNRLNCSHNEAERFITKYFERFPKVKDFMDATEKKASEMGYVETILNRKILTPEIKEAESIKDISSALRSAVNAPVQGSASEIIKCAMIKVNQLLMEHSSNATMLLQVHDELVFEIPDDEVDFIVPKIKEVMENAIKLDVPLVAEESIGNDWSQEMDLSNWQTQPEMVIDI